MDYVFYIASVLGAAAVWMMLPAERPRPRKAGMLLGVAALGGLLIWMLGRVGPEQQGPGAFYYVFTAIAVASAVRVITHPRPVYSALFFVMVVLSAAGLFVVLEAEFMAFAMVIIYAGAILVTYLFVIMLATLPQAPGEEEKTPIYDRAAREPVSSVVLGFALLAVLSHVMFHANPKDLQPTQVYQAKPALATVVNDTPGRVIPLLRELELVDKEVDLGSAQLEMHGVDTLLVAPAGAGRAMRVPLDPDTRAALIDRLGNIDRIGLALFEGHPLGIELAGVILLLSMVGAIVIGKKRVLEEVDAELDTQTGGEGQRG